MAKILGYLAGLILLACSILQPASGWAVVPGRIDTFQDGTTQNWIVGATPSPAPPVNVPSGGPAGAGDAYLRLKATGTASGPGNRLSVINQTQWAGNYPAAGINAITMWVNNQGSTNLNLRLLVGVATPPGFPPSDSAISTVPVFLPAGSGWTEVIFPITPDQLTTLAGSAVKALSNAAELRILHNPNPTFPPPVIAAQLGVDNIKAVGRHPGPPFLPLLLLDQ